MGTDDLGHAPAPVIHAITRAAANGTSYGAPTELEVRLAQMIAEAVPSMEQVRLVNSGTEAIMSAIRVARAHTKRDGILKFEGCYHGHADYLLAKAGSGVATLGLPDSPGVPADFTRHTMTAPYNDLNALHQMIETHADELACVIVEPVAGNMGVVPPHEEFLPTLRELTQRHGIVLIFDEVITGFRVHYGGAQALYGITPDLTCLGKIIGGGLPVGAYGGSRELMQQIAPAGPVYQAGTLSGNPLAVTAGIETLKQLQASGVYEKLEERARAFADGLGGRGCEKSRRPVDANAGRVDDGRVLCQRPGDRLCIGKTIRHATLRQVLPSHAQQGDVLCPIPVRSRFSLHRAYFTRPRADGCERVHAYFGRSKSLRILTDTVEVD